MELEYSNVFCFRGNLNNNKETYEQIGKLYNFLVSCKTQKVVLDFSKVSFIAANLFAVLGACLDYSINKNCHKIFVKGLNNTIKQLIARNGFNRYFRIESIDDNYRNSIRYEIFQANTEQLTDFERYLILYVFDHKEMPAMSDSYRNLIIDNFLEIFNNVIDHAEAESVYVCGQFFHKKKILDISIVDIGLSFDQKINKYFKDKGLKSPEKCIEWAIMSGNSTKTETPGGLGLTVLMEFLRYNAGSFTIVSGREFYCYDKEKAITQDISQFFPGTIVTIRIDLSDEKLYLYNERNDETIFF